jgi:hypothetical protein
VRNIVVENVTSRKSKRALYLRGYPNAPVSGVRLSHCSFGDVAESDLIENVENLRLEDVKRNGKLMVR